MGRYTETKKILDRTLAYQILKNVPALGVRPLRENARPTHC